MYYAIICRQPGREPYTVGEDYASKPEQLKPRLLSEAFRQALSGQHGKYPKGNGSLIAAIKRGLSPDGLSWTARDGTKLSIEPVE